MEIHPEPAGARPPGPAACGWRPGGPGARQAIVRGGRRPFGPEGQVELASCEGNFPGAGF
ncbi:MAG: hypothetical protein NTY37_07010 [Methanothrix sp.]|nr:hypothetical protein [Methanothrix sp.]